MPYWQLFDKYGKFQPGDMESSDMQKIHLWLKDIYQEILDSVCYYQFMTDKGETAWSEESLAVPKLKAQSQHQDHQIWTLHDTKDQSVLTGIARKTQFIMASIDAFSPLNKIDSLKDRHLQRALKSTAEHVIAPSANTMQYKKSKLKPGQSRQQEQHSAQLSMAFGALFAKSDSLTHDEIQSHDTKTPSAVEKLKDQLKPPKK